MTATTRSALRIPEGMADRTVRTRDSSGARMPADRDHAVLAVSRHRLPGCVPRLRLDRRSPRSLERCRRGCSRSHASGLARLARVRDAANHRRSREGSEASGCDRTGAGPSRSGWLAGAVRPSACVARQPHRLPPRPRPQPVGWIRDGGRPRRPTSRAADAGAAPTHALTWPSAVAARQSSHERAQRGARLRRSGQRSHRLWRGGGPNDLEGRRGPAPSTGPSRPPPEARAPRTRIDNLLEPAQRTAAPDEVSSTPTETHPRQNHGLVTTRPEPVTAAGPSGASSQRGPLPAGHLAPAAVCQGWPWKEIVSAHCDGATEVHRCPGT